MSGLTSGVPFLDGPAIGDGFQLGESHRASVPGPTQALPSPGPVGNQSAAAAAAGCGQELVENMECFMVLSGGQQLAVALLALTLGACTLLENLLVLCVILRSRALRWRPSYLFMGSLAAADLLGGVIFVYSFLDFHVLHRKDSPRVFLFKLAGVIASFSASVGSLFLTAIDRFLSVQRPLAYRRRLTRRRALLAFTLMWSVSIAVSLLPLLGWNCKRLNSVCSDIFPLIDRTYLMLWMGMTVLLLLFIVYAYVFILWKSHRRAVRMLSRGSRRSAAAAAAARPEQVRVDLRLAKTLVLILVALVVCWGPLLAIMSYDLFGKVNDFVKTVFAFCSMLCLLNSAANPIIYAMRSKDLRRAFLGLCRSRTHTPDGSGESDWNSRSVRSMRSAVLSAGKDGRCGKAQVKVAQASVCGLSQASSVEAV